MKVVIVHYLKTHDLTVTVADSENDDAKHQRQIENNTGRQLIQPGTNNDDLQRYMKMKPGSYS